MYYIAASNSRIGSVAAKNDEDFRRCLQNCGCTVFAQGIKEVMGLGIQLWLKFIG